MIGECSIKSFQNQLLNNDTSLESSVIQLFAEIKEKDVSINSFVNLYEDQSILKAQEIDQKLKSGASLGKLFGSVISIKDNICYQDHPVTASSAILKDFKPIYSSTAVERLLAEDAIIIGSTNCDEFGMGSSNENSVYGTVSNPNDLSKVAGGSSGGAAASVAAGFCHVAIASDTGGSVRQPAAFCGVLGFKPSYGRVSRYGLLAYASSFDQIGILALYPEDISLVLSVIEGKDEFDSTVCNSYLSSLNKNGSKVAFIRHSGESSQAKKAMDQAYKVLNDNGIICESAILKQFDYMVPSYYIIAMAEASSNLSRYDGIHYGVRPDNINDLNELYTETRTAGFGTEVKRRIMTGSFILSAGYYEAYYKKAQKVRRLLVDEVIEILNDYDYLIMPVSNHSAFTKGEKVDPVEVYQSDKYTVLANMCGLPAISIPLSKTENGLPFALQVHANQFQDNSLLEFGQKLKNILQ
ncbi:MAG: Asp-tRNA(Asn)/Glu-tRNA(Gln) amidotransferase subunit GatA [Chitinophagales bacterium]|nr:Asp-tRNA(Asn)/Glu-tRNA(Gln) amidotransferase subunit GatA [Chitinophagales bacterium]